jgi:flotillin
MEQLQDIPLWILAVPAGVLSLLFFFIVVVVPNIHVCRPSEILIFSGRQHATIDGRHIGFRVVHGGRGFRWPVVETVNRMDVSLISVPMRVRGAYSEGGIPLNVDGVANIKVSSNDKVANNAIERFLGHDRNEIGRVAKETLEGHLRGVLATLTPEEVNEDRLKFASMLSAEAEDDLQKLGLQLDTLKIQHVSDERDYLESIGRPRIAEILREAEVAESNSLRAAEEAEAGTRARGEVAATRARANIQRKQNELRQIKAELEAQAKSEEERAIAGANEARATAEKLLQEIRGQLEELRLIADVTIPADVDRQVCEHLAAGDAATIAADGEAMALSLAAIAAAWRDSQGRAMDMFVLQHLDEIFGKVAKAARNLKVGEVNLVDGGDGKTLPSYASAYPATVGALLFQVSQTLGVDVSQVITGRSSAEPGKGVSARLKPALSGSGAGHGQSDHAGGQVMKQG